MVYIAAAIVMSSSQPPLPSSSFTTLLDHASRTDRLLRGALGRYGPDGGFTAASTASCVSIYIYIYFYFTEVPSAARHCVTVAARRFRYESPWLAN